MCENNNNNNNAIDQELLDLSHSLKAAYNALEASTNTACMTQLQHKRFDLDILDSEAIRVCKFSTELMAYSFKISDIMKKLSATRNLWVKLNGITKEQSDELDKKIYEASDKAVKEFKAHLKEVIDG